MVGTDEPMGFALATTGNCSPRRLPLTRTQELLNDGELMHKDSPRNHHLLSTATALFAGLGLVDRANAQDYDLELMAVTGTSFNTIDIWVSLNDDGICAFTGRDATNISKAFIATGPGVTMPVTFGSANRTFEGASINNQSPPWVATRDRISGAWLIRKWSSSGSLANTIIGQSPAHFDSGQLFVDINDSGVVAFSGLTGGSSFVELFVGSASPPTSLATYTGSPFVRPQISNDYSALGGLGAKVIMRDNLDRIVAWPAAGGGPEIIAGTSAGFVMKGNMPGISHDGRIGAFIGDRGNGEGFFVGVPVGNSVQIEPVAGDTLDDGFTDFAEGQRAGILANGRIGGSSGYLPMITAVFTATRNGSLGVYAVDAFFDQPSGPLVPRIGAPKAVARVGDTVSGKMIQGVTVYDQVNRCGQVAFQASFTDGTSGVVRATRRIPPTRRLRVSCLRVLGPLGKPNPFWTVQNVLETVNGASALLSAANVELIVDCVEDIADPNAGGLTSLFQVDVGSLSTVESNAKAMPATYGWRADGINMYFVDSIAAPPGSVIFGVCSFPNATSPCDSGGNREIIVIAPSLCPVVTGGPATAQTAAHEIGHFLNLLHTHQGADPMFPCTGPETGPTAVPPAGSLYQAPNRCIAGDLIADTPSDPANGAILATWYGVPSVSHSAVIDNLMSQPCDSTAATSQTMITRGQALRMHQALDLFRRHVVETSSADSRVLGAGRPEIPMPPLLHTAAPRLSLCMTPPNVNAPQFLSVRGGPPFTVGLLFFGVGPGLNPPTPFMGLSLYLPGATPVGTFQTDANGRFFATLPPLPLAGLTLTLQGVLLNELTHGVQVTFGL